MSKPDRLLIALILIFIALTPLKIFSLIGILLFGASLLRVRIGYFYKLILAFSIFFAINTLVAGVFFVLKVGLPIDLILIAYIIVLTFLALPNNVSSKDILSILTPGSLWKIALSFALFLAIIAPVLSRNDFSAYTAVSFGGDNVSHLELIKAVEQNKGYFYEPFEVSKEVAMEGLSGYPQGFHINAYLFKQVLEPIVNLASNYGFILYFYSFSAMMYILFAWLFFLATRGFLEKSSISPLPGLLATITLFTGTFFSLFALGSQSQIASMALFIAMLAFLNYSIKSKHREDKINFLCLAIILLGGISFTWLLLLPIAGIIVAYVFCAQYLKPAIREPAKYAKLIIVTFSVFLTALIQPIVQFLYSSPKNNGVNEVGFSITPSLYLVAALVITATFFLIRKNRARRLWILALFVPSLFSAIIYVYQLSQVGEARYYLYKSIFVIVLVAVIIISAGVGEIVSQNSRALNKKTRYLVLLLTISIGSLIALYNNADPNGYLYQRAGGGFSKEVAVTAIGRINENPASGKSIISVGSCNRAHDYTATRLVGALSTGNSSARQALLKGQLTITKESLHEAVAKYQIASAQDLIIISSDYQLQKYLEKKLQGGTRSEEFIDLDFGHIPKNTRTCPEAVL